METILYCLWPIVNIFNSYIFKKLIEETKSQTRLKIIEKQEYHNNKIIRNMNGFYNVLGTVCLYFLYLYTNNNTILSLSIIYPKTFYTYDIYFILHNKLSSEYPYVYHHVIAVFMLEYMTYVNDTVFNLLYKSFMAAEISNIPLYVVYFLVKTITKSTFNYYIILYSKVIQTYWFMIIRIFYFGRLIYYELHLLNEYLILKYSLLTIYLMGFYWLIGQIKSLLNDIKKKNNDNEKNNEKNNQIKMQ